MSKQHIMPVTDRVIIRVIRQRGAKAWRLKVGGLSLPAPTQEAAIGRARCLAHEHANGGGHVEVVIHGRDGRIRYRDTYPRSSDPRRSKG